MSSWMIIEGELQCSEKRFVKLGNLINLQDLTSGFLGRLHLHLLWLQVCLVGIIPLKWDCIRGTEGPLTWSYLWGNNQKENPKTVFNGSLRDIQPEEAEKIAKEWVEAIIKNHPSISGYISFECGDLSWGFDILNSDILIEDNSGGS